MTEQMCDTDEDDEERMRIYEGGHWTWDEKIQGLNFVRLVKFALFNFFFFKGRDEQVMLLVVSDTPIQLQYPSEL